MAYSYDLKTATTTLNLNGGTDYTVLQAGFSAPPPRRRLTSATNIFRDGADILERRYNNRTVVVPLRIHSTSQDDLITNINSINALLERGAEYTTRGLGSQLILSRKWNSATNSVDFHVLEGVLSIPEVSPSHIVNTEMVPAVLTLLCKPFAVGSSETIENFVADPGFEVAGSALADWTSNHTGSGTSARDTSVKKDGASSLKLVMTSSSSGQLIERNQALADVDAAEVWSFQCWVRVDALNNCKVVMEIDYNTGTDVEVSTTTVNASEFVRLTSANNTVPGSVTSATLRLRLEATGASATGVVYIDNVIAVQAASVPSAWVSSHSIANNYADSSQAAVNYLDIYDVPGDVPALLQVKATEDEAHTKLWVGARHAGRQTDGGIWHEAEDFGTWATEPSDGSPSGGNYGETGPSLYYDATSTGNTSASTAVTVSHTCSSSGNRLLVVGVSANSSQANVDNRFPSGVTYDGSALTKIGQERNGTMTVSLWYRVAPSTGANDIVATFPAAFTDCVVGGVSFLNADQTSPVGTIATATANSAAPSVAVASNAGDFVVDTVASSINGTLTVGSGQTQRWNAQVSTTTRGGGSTERASTSTTSTTMDWTLESSQEWATSGVAVKPLATSISLGASSPLIQSKTVSSPPEGVYRVLARARRTATDVDNYLGIGYSYGDITKDPSAQGDYQVMSGSAFAIYDLGSLTIPPLITPDNATSGPLALRLALYADGDGTSTTVMEVDWVMLLPVDFGSGFVSKTSGTDVVLVDSMSPGFKGLSLLDASDVIQSVPANQLGKPPEAHPDGTRLYFAYDEGTAAAIALDAQVSITYVPRFLQVAPA